MLSSNIEQLIGCDFALLLNAGDRFKLIYIEAKRTQKEWDRRRNPSPVAAAHYGIAMRISRFSDQIGRQAVWLAGHNAHFIAEMFLQVVSPAVADPPYDNPLLFDPQGSTFITHQRAREVVDPPIIGGTVQFPVIETWTTPAAGGGPSGQEIALNGHALNIEQLLNGVIECRFGEVVHGDWRTHIAALAMHQGAAPGDLTGYLRALGLRAILIVDGEAPPAWMG